MASGGDGSKVYTASALGQALVITRFKDNLLSVVESVAATGWLTSILQLGSIVGFMLSGVFGEVFSRKYTIQSSGFLKVNDALAACGFRSCVAIVPYLAGSVS
jgi:MFS family permease